MKFELPSATPNKYLLRLKKNSTLNSYIFENTVFTDITKPATHLLGKTCQLMSKYIYLKTLFSKMSGNNLYSIPVLEERHWH